MALEVVRSRSSYRRVCEEAKSIPLFSQAWWLDAVAGECWGAVLAYNGQKVVGTHPFVLVPRLGLTVLTQPKLTQTLGPWVRPTDKSYPRALAHEKEVLGVLAEGLPNYDRYFQNWHCERKNWLPFYWRGFEQTTRYTYRIRGVEDEQTIWNGMQENIRREIRKARARFHITVRPCRSLDEFLALNRMTFARQGHKVPYSDDLVSRIDRAATARSSSDCLIAVDPSGKSHAGAYIVRQGDTAYYLLGGGDPAHRSSGAMSLVLWEAIRGQPEGVEIFDFEGSMIEPIERFFRAFGAIQVPYFRVYRTPSRVLKATYFVRSLIKTT